MENEHFDILRVLPSSEEVKQLYLAKYNHTSDSGVDLFCPETIVVAPRSQAKINFQIRCEVVNVYNKQIAYLLVPRSSIVNTPLRMSNSIGLIDSSFKGEICAFVDNISEQAYTIEKGTRLFQLCNANLIPLIFTIVKELSSSKRGEDGFGSTGK